MAFAVESTSSDPGGVTDATSVSFSHTVTAANVLIGTVGMGDTNGATSVSSMTYAAVGFTLVVRIDDANWEIAEIWKLTASVATGANTFTVNLTGFVGDANAEQVGCGVTGFTDASTTLGTASTNAATSTNPNVTVVDSASGNIVVSICATDGSASATTEGGTLLWEVEDIQSDSDFNAQQQTASGASTVCSWTNATSASWVAAGVAIAAAGGGGDVNRVRFPVEISGMGVGGMLGGNRVN